LEKLDATKKSPWGELATIVVAIAVLFIFVEWQRIVAIATVAVGLGFVIFWHELGHFLVAKWSDVKVLKFSIGFGLPGIPPIVSYRKGMGITFFGTRNKEYEELQKAGREGIQNTDIARIGETEYALGVLPLGGFVRMLGEDPADEESKTSDPRAYANKPVGVRMAIISAGVLMNLVLGIVAFMVVYMVGTMEIPAVVGAVVAGSPAYLADLRPGDEIISIDGRGDINYLDMKRMVALTHRTQQLRFEIKRPSQTQPIFVNLHPTRAPGEPLPTIGVGPPIGMQLAPDEPFAQPPGMTSAPKGPDGGFKGDDEIIGVGVDDKTEPVRTWLELDQVLARYASRPVDIVVRRRGSDKNGETAEVAVTVPPNHVMTVGARMTAGAISAMRPNSIAERAGFQVNDFIVKVDGDASYDPVRLPQYVYDHAGRPVTFEVARKGTDGESRTVTLSAVPDATPAGAELIYPREPLEVSGLGMAFPVLPRVASVDAGSPADKAGIKTGDEVTSVIITTPAADKKSSPSVRTVKVDPKHPSWLIAFESLQLVDRNAKIQVTLTRSKTPIDIQPQPDPKWFSVQRGLQPLALIRKLPPQSVASAAQRAWRETCEVAFSLYAMIRGLVQNRVPGNQVAGVIRISTIAYDAARAGLDPLTRFLAMLSVNLAVLNFLPIPPLDGGQFLFLAAEKIRGRPLPERAQVFLMIAGIVFVVILFVVVTFNDIASLITSR
jgi:regulator of sigma E protease